MHFTTATKILISIATALIPLANAMVVTRDSELQLLTPINGATLVPGTNFTFTWSPNAFQVVHSTGEIDICTGGCGDSLILASGFPISAGKFQLLIPTDAVPKNYTIVFTAFASQGVGPVSISRQVVIPSRASGILNR